GAHREEGPVREKEAHSAIPRRIGQGSAIRSPRPPRRWGEARRKRAVEETMRARTGIVALALAALVCAAGFAAEKTVMVGGAAMYPSKDIIDNAVNSKDHMTLVAAVKAAGLVDTLKGKGPFTVFAPTDAAFAKLPAGTVDSLLKPENKAMLQGVLTYHVVAGMH